jgi:hypothetical protein
MKSCSQSILLWRGRVGPNDGERGAVGEAPGAQSRHKTAVVRDGCPRGPHLLSTARPNKPALFGVTFDVVPTGSHTSPNPAKICAKLNQSILEMVLVSFCHRSCLQGTEGLGGAIGM